MKRETISACIITFNEEKNIRDCLESITWCDEIIVVDSGSTDSTTDIAKAYAVRVYYHEWAGYKEQKKIAFSLATSEWTLSIDADERRSIELRDEILQLLRTGTRYNGFLF